jgi:hypothetical protein
MTLPEFAMLCRYWRRSPPTHLLLAALLGAGEGGEATRGDYADLFRLFGAPAP